MNSVALRETLRRIDPRLWLIIGLGTIIVGFCLYKALAATTLNQSPTDRPAPAFDPVTPTLISSPTYLQSPRLPTDIYLSLSDRAYAVARQAMRGRLSIAAFRAQGMSPSVARRSAAYFANIAGTVRSLSVNYGTYALTALTAQTATFSSTLQLSDHAGDTPRNATSTLIFQSSDGFKHSALTSITFTLS